MSDTLKCPYCGGILEQSSIFNLNSYACTDLTCKGYYMSATKDMWQELIRTRKALDVAVGVLKGLKPEKAKGGGYWTYRTADVIKVINKALKQINEIKGGK